MTCKQCGSPIIWATTVNDKIIALDAEPVLLQEGAQFILARRGIAHSTGGQAYTAHYSHCMRSTEEHGCPNHSET